MKFDINKITELEKIIKYSFKDKELLILALKHRSITGYKDWSNENNERLEFLGDAILEFIVVDFLYKKFPNKQEGELSKIKSTLVSRKILAIIIKNLKINEYIIISEGEEQTGGRERPSILANVYEAILAAIYLDGGIRQAKKFVNNTILKNYNDFIKDINYFNFKSRLLEFIQGKFKVQPIYKVIEESGPDHNKTFTINVYFKDRLIGQGKGSSKKSAQQEAAHNALIRLGVLDE